MLGESPVACVCCFSSRALSLCLCAAATVPNADGERVTITQEEPHSTFSNSTLPYFLSACSFPMYRNLNSLCVKEWLQVLHCITEKKITFQRKKINLCHVYLPCCVLCLHNFILTVKPVLTSACPALVLCAVPPPLHWR